MAFAFGCEIALHYDDAQTARLLGIVQFGSHVELDCSVIETMLGDGIANGNKGGYICPGLVLEWSLSSLTCSTKANFRCVDFTKQLTDNRRWRIAE